MLRDDDRISLLAAASGWGVTFRLILLRSAQRVSVTVVVTATVLITGTLGTATQWALDAL